MRNIQRPLKTLQNTLSILGPGWGVGGFFCLMHFSCSDWQQGQEVRAWGLERKRAFLSVPPSSDLHSLLLLSKFLSSSSQLFPLLLSLSLPRFSLPCLTFLLPSASFCPFISINIQHHTRPLFRDICAAFLLPPSRLVHFLRTLKIRLLWALKQRRYVAKQMPTRLCNWHEVIECLLMLY